MADQKSHPCPDCGGVSRRDFVRVAGGAALVAGTAPLWTLPRAFAAPSYKSSAETAAARLHGSLSDEQKKTICFPFEHQLKDRHNANWAITKPSIRDDFYTAEQRKTIDEIFRACTSPDGYERFIKQMDEDYGGIESYHVALFGEPGSGKFQFEMTGRHHTIRADGDSVEGMAFGGPIVYGHGIETPSENVFHYQTKAANEVFAALDAGQRKQALLPRAPGEANVPLQGKTGKFPGIAVGELKADQQELVAKCVKVILAPYRQEDVDEALEVVKAGGGLDKLHVAFYQNGDLENDKVWDIWRVEGPTFVVHFRGAPHVHAYINVGTRPAAEKKG
ncbi:MAG: DUF3500 domain-containing protein [Planctomycetales bacterium]